MALSPSSIAVRWDLQPVKYCELFPFSELRVFYTKDTENATGFRSVDVNRSKNHMVIQHLEHFKTYLVWLQTLTTGGLGPKSKAVKTRTLEKGEQYQLHLFLHIVECGWRSGKNTRLPQMSCVGTLNSTTHPKYNL